MHRSAEPADPPQLSASAKHRFLGRSRLLACGLGLTVIVALVSVLFASTGSQVTDPLAQAATLSSGTPGYRMHLSMTMAVPILSTPITASGDAVVDERDHAASMSFSVDLSQVPQAVQQLGSTTMQMSMIVEGDVLYVKFPQAVFARALGGEDWVKMDFAKLAGLPNIWSLGGSPATSDPSDMLQYLQAASNSVTEEGHQQLDGVTTTHYKAEISLDRLPPTVPAVDSAAMRQMLSSLEQATHTDLLPIDVWIDPQHLVRRMVMSLRLPVSGTVMNESVTADFTDYGPQPRPAPPPTDQVRDLSSLISGANGLGAGSSGLTVNP